MVFTLTLVKGNIKWNWKPCQRCGESTNHIKSRKWKQCGVELQKRQPVIKPVSSNQFSYYKHQLFRKVIKNFLFWCDTCEVTHQHKIVLLLFYCFSIGEISWATEKITHTYVSFGIQIWHGINFHGCLSFCFVNSLKC